MGTLGTWERVFGMAICFAQIYRERQVGSDNNLIYIKN